MRPKTVMNRYDGVEPTALWRTRQKDRHWQIIMVEEWWSDLAIEDEKPGDGDLTEFRPFDTASGVTDRRPNFATILIILSLGFGVSFSLLLRVGGSFESLYFHLCNSFCINTGIVALCISQYRKGRDILSSNVSLAISVSVAFFVTLIFYIVAFPFWSLVDRQAFRETLIISD